MANPVRRLSPICPSIAPARLCVRLSIAAYRADHPAAATSSEVRSALFHCPGLPFLEQALEVGGLAFGRRLVLPPDVGFEGRTRVVVEDAERHREFAEAHFDQHVRDAAVVGVMDDHARGLPAAIDDLDDLDLERFRSEKGR